MGVKISELQEKATANDTDVLPIVGDGTKKITKANFLREVNDKVTGTNLYENESGTNAETINLSENCENFKFIEIQYKLISSNTPYYSSRRIHEPNGKETCLDILTTLSGGSQLLIGTILIAFDGAVATTRRNYTFLGATKASEKEMFITKIIGYK